jgi:hypothetical protein
MIYNIIKIVNYMGSHRVHNYWMYQDFVLSLAWLWLTVAETCRQVFNFADLIHTLYWLLQLPSLLISTRTWWLFGIKTETLWCALVTHFHCVAYCGRIVPACFTDNTETMPTTLSPSALIGSPNISTWLHSKNFLIHLCINVFSQEHSM